MKCNILVFIVVFAFANKGLVSYSQVNANTKGNVNKILDSLSSKGITYKTMKENNEVSLTKEQALKYLQIRYGAGNWNNPNDPFRQAIGRLLFFATNNRYDSTRLFLERYSYDSLNVPWDRFYVWDTLQLNNQINTHSEIKMPADGNLKADTVLISNLSDSVKSRKTISISDFSKFRHPLILLKDSVILVAVDTLAEVKGSGKGFPFIRYRWPYERDSIKAAITSLSRFIEESDSSIINISGRSDSNIPVWLNSKNRMLSRFWLRNEYSDSVTVWVGGISQNRIGLFLEDGIVFRRPTKQRNFSDARLNIKEVDSRNLQEVKQVPVKQQYWKFRSESAFTLSQTSLSNWVKGGENSFSGGMDLTGFADYNNKLRNMSSNNYIRLKYGLLKSGENPIRKNMDLLESNSKLNHRAFGKFDFSAVLLIKTQISKGYNYPNDSIPVSKFINPAIITFGLGLDFKPNKTTSINFSPLSYKATLVTDTAHIDQTKYGIPHDRKSLNEPGASLIITNEFKPFKVISITNRLQLFTNYIHNPQNVDVDWEMIITSKINWFTDVRFNTHLIFDDDTKTPVLHKDGTPKLDSGGKPVKTARVQFKELLGFTFVFRF